MNKQLFEQQKKIDQVKDFPEMARKCITGDSEYFIVVATRFEEGFNIEATCNGMPDLVIHDMCRQLMAQTNKQTNKQHPPFSAN